MYFERQSFLTSFRERVEQWDLERVQRFLLKHELELRSPDELNVHWDGCRQLLLENMQRLGSRIPETPIYDDKYMSGLWP